MIDWSRTVSVNGIGTVAYSLGSTRPIVKFEIDLIGDGLAAPVSVTGSDLRPFGLALFTPKKAGTFSVSLYAEDDQGCFDRTTRERPVVVR